MAASSSNLTPQPPQPSTDEERAQSAIDGLLLLSRQPELAAASALVLLAVPSNPEQQRSTSNHQLAAAALVELATQALIQGDTAMTGGNASIPSQLSGTGRRQMPSTPHNTRSSTRIGAAVPRGSMATHSRGSRSHGVPVFHSRPLPVARPVVFPTNDDTEDDEVGADYLRSTRAPAPTSWRLFDRATLQFSNGQRLRRFTVAEVQAMNQEGRVSDADLLSVTALAVPTTEGVVPPNITSEPITRPSLIIKLKLPKKATPVTNTEVVNETQQSLSEEEASKYLPPLRPGSEPRLEYLSFVVRDAGSNLIRYQYREPESVTAQDWQSASFCRAVNRWRQQRARRSGVISRAPPVRYSETEIDWLRQRSLANPGESMPDTTAAFNEALSGSVVDGIEIPERTVAGINAQILRNPELSRIRGLTMRKNPKPPNAPKRKAGESKIARKIVLVAADNSRPDPARTTDTTVATTNGGAEEDLEDDDSQIGSQGG